MRTTLDYKENDNWLWSITCADCPLLPHLSALGKQPRNCSSGMITNMQGHVTVNRCEHWGGDNALKVEESGDNKVLIGECNYKALETNQQPH